MSKTRREVLRDVFVVLPLGWVVMQAGCSSSSVDCADANKLVSTATAITVTSVCNEHTHDFTVMMTDLANIQAGMTVTKTSGSALGHTHDFNFRLTA